MHGNRVLREDDIEQLLLNEILLSPLNLALGLISVGLILRTERTAETSRTVNSLYFLRTHKLHLS